MKQFKILSIDGGGIKGLYSASILREFEQVLRKEKGDEKRIVDYFDLICGTSTGGIIALALSLRIPTETICDFYELYGPKIFKHSKGIIPLLKQTLFGGKFSDKELKIALREMFHEKKIGDSECLLCIPAFDFTNGTFEIFKFDHKEGNFMRDNDLPVVEVALATTAAPTFFPLAEVKLHNNIQYVDGGVWATNPSLIGFTEAIRYFVGSGKQYDSIQILSVASLNIGKKNAPFLKRNRSFIRWAPDLFNLSLIGQSEFTDIFLKSVQSNTAFPINYVRIPSYKIEGEHGEYIKLDLAEIKSMTLMKQFGSRMFHEIRHDPNLRSFFDEEKTYIINNTR